MDKSKIIGLIIAISVLIVAGYVSLQYSPRPQQAQRPQPSVSIDKSPETQAKRRDAIVEMTTKLRLFSKVEMQTKNVPHVWVLPRFYTATYDQKSDFLNVVYGYHCDDHGVIRLFDSMTGKQIGTYDLVRGLELE